jgi:hypothetical protein
MKTTREVALMVIMIFLILSTIICGLWLRFTTEIVEQSSKDFHLVLATFTSLFVIISTILFTSKIKTYQKN